MVTKMNPARSFARVAPRRRILSRVGAGRCLMVVQQQQHATTRNQFLGWNHTEARRFYQELSYIERGDPTEKLVYQSEPGVIPEPPSMATRNHDWILVECLAAPCNPADLNVVEGKYPSPHSGGNTKEDTTSAAAVAPPLPKATSYMQPEPCQVGGAEALGRVLDVRKGDSSSPTSEPLAVGDTVVLAESGWGSWRSHVWVPSHSVLHVPNEVMEKAHAQDGLNVAQVALISQVAGTAYRLLQDFVTIQPGDVVIQNAGTSAVSMCSAELMRYLYPESHLVSFVRRKDDDRQGWSALIDLLTRQQTTRHTIVSEDTALSAADDSKQAWNEWKAQHMPSGRVALGLNSVHGPQTSRLFFSLLSDHAKLVTYGAMSKQALPVPAAPLIFKDVSVCGYWHSRWMVANRRSPLSAGGVCPRQQMLDELANAVLHGGLALPPVHAVDLSETSNGVQGVFEQVPTKPLRAKLVWNLQK